MSRCPICERKADRPAPHQDMTREYYDVLIKPLSHVAYRYGYALTTHGSLNYDIDLVACPWRVAPASAESLAKALQEATKGIIGYAEDDIRNPTKKPCGRLAWIFYLTHEPGYGPYIDLSVMPVGTVGTAETAGATETGTAGTAEGIAAKPE